MKQAVILAGGKGTRLGERLGNLPKPLIDICGLPLLERQILLAKNYQFTHIIILVNYRADLILDFCTSRDNWGLNIQCIDDGEPLGTAGAVIQILDLLESEFLVLYGDTMLEVDLDRFHRYHINGGSDVSATLFLHPNDHPQDSDLVQIDQQGFVIGFYPYPHNQKRYYANLVNAALYWVHRDALEPWRGHRGQLDFGKQIFPSMIQLGMKLRGYKSTEYIKDCGTPLRLDKVCSDFKNGRIHRANLTNKQKAVFIDRDGTINEEINYINKTEQFKLLSGTEKAVRRLNIFEYRVCIVTNQPVVARGDCSIATLEQIHNKLETLLGHQGAFVDKIYYCPHHPDRGFNGEIQSLKIDCLCRKPHTGMIDVALSEFNISKEQSWMIGDSTTDILTAKRAGIRSILVETGFAGLDQKYIVTPDYILPNLATAVDFILDTHPLLMEKLLSYSKVIEPGAIVLIGGQSRSGKSLLSSVLRERLIKDGKTVHLVSTDNWIRSENQREDGLLGRHDINEMIEFTKNISHERRPTNVTIPGYNKVVRQHVQNVDKLKVGIKDIFIIEGVVALTLAKFISSTLRIYVTIDEEIRKSRFIREYLLRGFNETAAIKIYEQRLIDEFDVVAESQMFANSIYNENCTISFLTDDY